MAARFRGVSTRSTTLPTSQAASAMSSLPPRARPEHVQVSIFQNSVLRWGLSYGRSLQGTQENFYGMHVWWEPKDTAFRLRSEFARGHHAQGYWVEADYRTRQFGGLNSWVGRFEPLIRMQQSWRRDTVVSDGLPLVNTERVDLGLDYNLPHNTRILTSYARQFSATGDHNVWETGIVYRFLFPTWKGK